jgi:hypothetical protein
MAICQKRRSSKAAFWENLTNSNSIQYQEPSMLPELVKKFDKIVNKRTLHTFPVGMYSEINAK